MGDDAQISKDQLQSFELADHRDLDDDGKIGPYEKPFFVIGGQSNAYLMGRYGGVEAVLSHNQIDATVIYKAWSGTSLTPVDGLDWYPFEDGDPNTGELNEYFYEGIETNLARVENKEVTGLLWVQGESDAYYDASSTYYENLEELHRQTIERLGPTKFVISELGSFLPYFNDHDPHSSGVVEAQRALAADKDKVSSISPGEIISELQISVADASADYWHYTKLGSEAIAYTFLQNFFSDLEFEYSIDYLDGASQITRNFVSSILQSQTLVDTNDLYDWSRVSETMVEDGSVAARTVIFDDGREEIETTPSTSLADFLV